MSDLPRPESDTGRRVSASAAGDKLLSVEPASRSQWRPGWLSMVTKGAGYGWCWGRVPTRL
jgi:hypothetical protein